MLAACMLPGCCRVDGCWQGGWYHLEWCRVSSDSCHIHHCRCKCRVSSESCHILGPLSLCLASHVMRRSPHCQHPAKAPSAALYNSKIYGPRYLVWQRGTVYMSAPISRPTSASAAVCEANKQETREGALKPSPRQTEW